jgi:pimeloyl-ACP methyl ester carboxylesterase
MRARRAPRRVTATETVEAPRTVYARGFAAAGCPLIGALLLAGCTAVKVRPYDPLQLARQRHADALRGGGASSATRESLRILGLPETACWLEPRPCLERIGAGQGLDDERRLSAIAELWLGEALAHDPPRAGERNSTLDAYLESARASYAYLFFTRRSVGERALEDRQDQVRDFFNHATERVATLLFAEAKQRGTLDEAHAGLTVLTDAWAIHRGLVDVPLPAGRPLVDLVAAPRLSFAGIRNVYRRDGFGAELVAVAAERPPGAAEETLASKEIGYVAVSAVLRFPGSSLDEVMAAREATIEAYGSASHESISLYGTEVRLAADFTAPYALWLNHSGFRRQVARVLTRSSEELFEPRVFLMQPYDPNRVTVVLIHGLASSPDAWINLANELTGDEEIRRNYQVWQVFYRSGLSLPYNTRTIRAALAQTLDLFDPGRTARASRRMVLVGHSVGGVIARLLVLDGGDALWRMLLGHAPSAEERQRLAVAAPYLDLVPMPEVGRAVFLASPHHGSPRARGLLGRLTSPFIKSPPSLVAKAKEIADLLEPLAPAGAAMVRTAPGAIEVLNGRDTYLAATETRPIASWVEYHSIIACARPTPSLRDCTDGLVPYTSAHLDGAASELTLRSRHAVQKTPAAILELRRILHLHLRGEREQPQAKR